MRCLALLAAIVLCGCPPKPAGPQVTTLEGDGFTVRIVADPFSLTITGADGREWLATASGPRFTFDEHTYEAQIIPGWDGYKSKERPWLEFTKGTPASSDARQASFTFAAENASATVVVSVEGKRVRWLQSIQSATRRVFLWGTVG